MNTRRDETAVVEKTIQLKDTTVEGVIRFAEMSFADALIADALYMRVDAPEVKEGRVRLINVHDGKQIERDADRRVVQHKAVLTITE